MVRQQSGTQEKSSPPSIAREKLMRAVVRDQHCAMRIAQETALNSSAEQSLGKRGDLVGTWGTGHWVAPVKSEGSGFLEDKTSSTESQNWTDGKACLGKWLATRVFRAASSRRSVKEFHAATKKE